MNAPYWQQTGTSERLTIASPLPPPYPQSRKHSTYDLDDDDFDYRHDRDYIIGGAGKWRGGGGEDVSDEYKLDASPHYGRAYGGGYGGGAFADGNPYAVGKYHVRAPPRAPS